MVATTRRARAGGATKPDAKATAKTRKKKTPSNLWSLAATIAARLCDPGDTLALCLVAAALLVGECLLCALVIVKVPCESMFFKCVYTEGEKKGIQSPREVALERPLPPSLCRHRALSLSLTKTPFPLFSILKNNKKNLKTDTEIDWEAYMEEVGGFLAGERDYKNLKGGTGPLVYPAGFVYLYAFLKKVTLGSVRPAQWFFAGVYLATHAVVLALYVRSRTVPPWALALLSLSKRLHSIYVLRCFNDGAAMLLAWGATLLLVRALSDGGDEGAGKGKGKSQQRKKALLVVASVAAFSLAVSVKMNVLLMAPPVAVLLLQGARAQEVAAGVVAGVALQIFLGIPFLLRFPGSYLGRAFELGRVFTHKWSVNFAFLSEEAFVSKGLAGGLAAAHLGVLFAFAGWRWTRKERGGKGGGKGNGGGLVAAAAECWEASFPPKSTRKSTRASLPPPRPALDAAHVFRVVAVGNFIGVVFARSLHYQVRRVFEFWKKELF